MVRIRLQRFGKPHRPFYRIVAIDSRKPRDSVPIEILGTYDPILKNENVKLKTDRIKYWLSVGAQPTETVRDILVKHNLLMTKEG